MKMIDPFTLAKKLGAHIVNLPELTREEVEANQYVLLGSPVVVPDANKSGVYYFGSKMLTQQGLSLDYVVGYVVSPPFFQRKEELSKMYLANNYGS